MKTRNYHFTDLPKIFEALRVKKTTGVLKLHQEKAIKSLFFKEGNLIYASSSENEDRLGDILLKIGKITQEHYKISADLITKTGKRQGSILVEMGVITPKELFEGLKYQIREIISSVILWDMGGNCEFQQGELPPNIIPIPIDLSEILSGIIVKLEAEA
ncbi:MAG: DUF4388 domain-containing protein [Nitrospirae bacterium]|nr:DUF4388 domain-containing protein [Nitrospirota bacterium]MBI3351692.1 DUF4388 domain-containing protein [Nitrospirota bacterium]